jgi:hypothetical protein
MLRSQEIYGLLCKGLARQQIHQSVADWGVSERQVDEYITKARQLVEKDCEVSRPAFLAQSLASIREIQQAAFKRGQYMCALQAVRLQAELTGLAAK